MGRWPRNDLPPSFSQAHKAFKLTIPSPALKPAVCSLSDCLAGRFPSHRAGGSSTSWARDLGGHTLNMFGSEVCHPYLSVNINSTGQFANIIYPPLVGEQLGHSCLAL